MKIVDIFEPYLYSLHYDAQQENEYERLMNLWTDVSYLRNFAKQNGINNINKFIEDRLKDAEQIQDLLEEITNQNNDLGKYFIPYHNQEYKEVQLSLRKGKHKQNGLRIYAIKIFENVYVITSGAIKMSDATQDHKDTDDAIKVLKKAQNYFKEEGVVDNDSFYELINELE